MSPPLQIRQVARLRSTTSNLQDLSPTREEHTNNPVQRPNCRGQGATKLRDNEMEALKRFPTKGLRKNDTTLKAVRGECRRHPPRPRGQERGAGRGTRVWKGSRQQAVVSTSRGVSLFSERTHPFTGEPIPRSISPKSANRRTDRRINEVRRCGLFHLESGRE